MFTQKDIEFDKQHIWHPYTSMLNPLPCFNVKSADGVRLKLDDGREIIDGMSSWWCMVHGYNNKRLNKAIENQLKNMAHVMFGGIRHQPAIDLAKKLIEITPKEIQKVFFSDSGSVAVEVAMKMAIQYWYTKGKPQKNKMLTIRNGYHGDTFNAMSVCDPDNGMHCIYTDILPVHYFVNSPNCKFNQKCTSQDIKEFEESISQNHHNIAAVILEPIVQGAGGMKFYSQEFLKQVRLLCDKYNVLLILDEIATGFGRTGKLFACEHADISPDIMTIGKALTGGYLSFAATLASNKVAMGISKGSPGSFMHGPTFMGNPLACSVAIESIKLLQESNWQNKVEQIQNQLIKELAPCKEYSSVKEVRVLGAIGVVEMKEPVNMAQIQKQFVDNGIWVRPFGKLVYIMPPFIITKEDLSILTQALCKVISLQNK